MVCPKTRAEVTAWWFVGKMLFLRFGRATGALGRVFAPSAQSPIRRMSGDAAHQVAFDRWCRCRD